MRTIFDKGDHIRIELKGEKHPATLGEMFDEIESRVPDCVGKPILVDATRSQYKGKNLDSLYSIMKARLGQMESKMALVVAEEFHYGLGRMISGNTFTDRELFMPFMDEAAAMEWLLG